MSKVYLQSRHALDLYPRVQPKKCHKSTIKLTFLMHYFISKYCTRANLRHCTHLLTTTQCCQLNDCYRHKRKCACDAVKIGILKAVKNEKTSSITNCSKIVDHTTITSSINNQCTFKHSVVAILCYPRGLNHIRFNRNVILTSILKPSNILSKSAKLNLMFLFS